MATHFKILDRIRSFRYAFAGLWTLLKTQHNAWIHAVATVIAIGVGIALRLSPLEWCMIILAIVGVWVAEAFNTAFEFLADIAHPQYHPLVKKAKDIAAAAVLLASLGALVIGVIVFAHRFNLG